MAPPSDLPTAPPIPDDEMARFRKRPKPDRTAPDASERNVVTVRYKRRLLWWVVAIAWPLTPVTFVLGIYLMVSFELDSSVPTFLLNFPPLYAAAFGTYLLTRKDLLTYDVRHGWIGGVAGRSALNRWRDGDRIEYSVPLGRLELIRANGRRRVLFRSGYLVDRASWTAFVDVFLAHQNTRAEDHRDTGAEPRHPSAPQPGLGPAVRVGVRWRFFGAVLLAGLALVAFNVAIWADAERSGADYDFFGLLTVMAGGYVLFGVLPIVCNPVLAYESGSDRVSVKTRGLPARGFPRPGFERLEHSVYDGVLYEVRADGKRRRVARGWARDQAAWKTFVDRFMRDQAAAESRSTGGEDR
ncbi:hypothetical protein LO763_14140 [Glycomyces sp. A-F 0318]|uniref:hypothetical protein n=1 Tax=Glycomyces amatae TaxID=2881355 RepID=UPI001E417249|nr:hypothetical protein [Glycomyces amatae]MCD0444757.1 hypothetical protein [Glycomyces amatae]